MIAHVLIADLKIAHIYIAESVGTKPRFFACHCKGKSNRSAAVSNPYAMTELPLRSETSRDGAMKRAKFECTTSLADYVMTRENKVKRAKRSLRYASQHFPPMAVRTPF